MCSRSCVYLSALYIMWPLKACRVHPLVPVRINFSISISLEDCCWTGTHCSTPFTPLNKCYFDKFITNPKTKAGEHLSPAKGVRRREFNLISPCFFVCLLVFKSGLPTLGGGGTCFIQFTNSNVNIFWDTLTGRPRNNV